MTTELTYIKTQNLLVDTSTIIESAKNAAYRSVNVVLVKRNWLLGKRIAEEQLGNQTREELYGKSVIENLAQQLTTEYGSGFDFSSLYKYVRFYQCFPNILDAESPKSFLLTWTHYRTLLQVDDSVARDWYANEAKGNEQLYASKYKLYLPSPEELRREIEKQKEIYQLQRE